MNNRPLSKRWFRKRSNKELVLCIVVQGVFSACATQPLPPTELIEARAAYNRAQAGPAAQYSPAELHVAETALRSAENSFADSGDSDVTKDLAYVAERKAQVAEAQAAIYKSSLTRQNTLAKSEMVTKNELQRTRETLQRERQERLDAERRASESSMRLRQAVMGIGLVTLEPRGTVMTIPSQTLFKPTESMLTPEGQQKLQAFIEPLLSFDGKVLVECHTDSRGKEDENREFSLARAQSVRNFIVRAGVKSEYARAVGMGAARPVGDNATPEGRTNNQRVEIVLQPN